MVHKGIHVSNYKTDSYLRSCDT